jgi:hypothetical protein
MEEAGHRRGRDAAAGRPHPGVAARRPGHEEIDVLSERDARALRDIETGLADDVGFVAAMTGTARPSPWRRRVRAALRVVALATTLALSVLCLFLGPGWACFGVLGMLGVTLAARPPLRRRIVRRLQRRWVGD